MASRFIQKIASDVLEASEKLSARLEYGFSALLTGELSNQYQPHFSPEISQGSDEGKSMEKEESSFGFEPLILKANTYEDITEMSDENDFLSTPTPLEGIARSIIGDIMRKQTGLDTALEHIHAFRNAIAWSEPFIICLLAFHVCLLCICVLVSRHGRSLYLRLAVMILIGLFVRFAERLNTYGNEHWRFFAKQNYFDQQGIFVSVMLCGPLLIDSFIMLVFFLKEASQLLVQVKTAELKKKRRMHLESNVKNAKNRRDKKVA